MYQTTHDFSGGRSLQLTIVEALAVAENVSRTKVRPLYQSVETDSLESLFAHAESRDATLCVTFDVAGRCVEVDSDGRVAVYEAEGESDEAGEDCRAERPRA